MGTTNFDAVAAASVAADAVAADALTIGDYDQAKIVAGSTAVDCSAGGTAEAAAIVTVPAGSILLDVIAVVTEAFDGGTTKTFEVGVSGNTDKYIDPTDMGAVTLALQKGMIGGANNDQKTPEYLAAATPIVATWTNTADASAGAVTVYYTYLKL